MSYLLSSALTYGATAAMIVALGASHSGAVAPPSPATKSTAVDQGSLAETTTVLTFWREAGPNRWFAKDPDFDRQFRERFLSQHEAAVRGELAHWLTTADSALALILLLDQFPRNAFRNTPRMYDTDALARDIAETAIAVGYDREVDAAVQFFFYLPFGHSEQLADQDRSVALARRLGEPVLSHAEHHRDIIRRFGRFPHRNAILERTSTTAEHTFLDEPMSSF